MAVAAYQHILTGGFNIYVLELVLLYLGGSLAILLTGPGRFSFDAGMAPLLLNNLLSPPPLVEVVCNPQLFHLKILSRRT